MNPYIGNDFHNNGTEISYKDHIMSNIRCAFDCYVSQDCTSGSADWMDSWIFKRNQKTAGMPFLKKRGRGTGNVVIRDVTCNENYQNTYSTPGEMFDLPEIQHRELETAIAITNRFKKWNNNPMFETCGDIIEDTVTDVINEYHRMLSQTLFDVLNFGEFDINANTGNAPVLWTPGLTPYTKVFGNRALFGTHNYGESTISNLFVASTTDTAARPYYTFVPYQTVYGVTVNANPLVSNFVLKLTDLEQAVRVHKMNNSLDMLTGKKMSCGCTEFRLYKNCDDFIERIQGFTPSPLPAGYTSVSPVESQVLKFESAREINVPVVDSIYIPVRTAYLVSSNHDMFYGDVFSPQIIYKDSSKVVGNERKDYIEFEWTIMYGIFTPKGITKIVF